MPSQLVHFTSAASVEGHQPREDGQASPGGDVTGILHFYQAPLDLSEPFFKVTDQSGAGTKNYGHNPIPIVIRDFRNRHSEFSLERHSFAAVSSTPVEGIDLTKEEDIHTRYSLNAEELILKIVPGSQRVVIFDSIIRAASPTELLRRPVRKVHIDQSPLGVYRRVKRYVSEHAAEEMVAGRLRVRLVNVWRPLVGPVADHPLAVAESLTIDEADLVKVKHIYPDSIRETYAVKYSPSQRFWYWSQMSTSEVLLLQCFDSRKHRDESGVLRNIRCAHASFCISRPEDERCERQSIEVRCLVIG